MSITIRDVRVILTAPEGINLVVVKVETSEPGLSGVGCATFTQRAQSVKEAVESYLKPFVVGKSPECIEDIWQSAMVSGYWRNGPVMNNALSGLDMALWDLKGKLAGMPLYQLLGGKCRQGVALYRHAEGRDPVEVEEKVSSFIDEGFRYVRCQMGGYGGSLDIDSRTHITTSPSSRRALNHSPKNAPVGAYYNPSAYARSIPALFEHLRSRLGFDVELIHDIHERLVPIEAIRLAKELEPYRLFYLEDPVAPEDVAWLTKLRDQTVTPIAMGELFTNPVEWLPIIENRWIDFIRCHLSAIGGITPARKLAVLCEAFGIRTAWHGPGDVSPVGHAANVHLDISSSNFGVQEWTGITDRLREVFPGAPEIENGYAYPNDKPGLGIEIDESAAVKYPYVDELPTWTLARTVDGTAVRP